MERVEVTNNCDDDDDDYRGLRPNDCDDCEDDDDIMIISNQVKDVRVPAQLMRAMAAEAEAAREARAKVSLMLMMTMMVVAYHQIPTRHIPTRWECVMMIRSWNVTLSYNIHHSYMGDKFRHGCTLFAWVTRLCIQKHILRKCIRWHLHCM